MLCLHGLPEESCPHCAAQMRIRPPIRLVQPMPTELPLDTVYASKKDNSSEVRNDFVQANKPLSNLLKMPKRQTGFT